MLLTFDIDIQFGTVIYIYIYIKIIVEGTVTFWGAAPEAKLCSLFYTV